MAEHKSFDRWERFALEHPELEHNVNVGIAPPCIDHGRLLVLERRAKLASLRVSLTHPDLGLGAFTLREALSPRRIYRRSEEMLPPWACSEIAERVHSLVQRWVDGGYIDGPFLGMRSKVGHTTVRIEKAAK